MACGHIYRIQLYFPLSIDVRTMQTRPQFYIIPYQRISLNRSLNWSGFSLAWIASDLTGHDPVDWNGKIRDFQFFERKRHLEVKLMLVKEEIQVLILLHLGEDYFHLHIDVQGHEIDSSSSQQTWTNSGWPCDHESHITVLMWTLLRCQKRHQTDKITKSKMQWHLEIWNYYENLFLRL